MIVLAMLVATRVAVAGPVMSTDVVATAPIPREEHLRYRASWNGIPVADAELQILPTRGRGRRAVELRGRAETNEVLDLLWRMRDSFEATVATDPPAPERFVLRQHENDHRRETAVARDATRNRLVGEKRKRGRPPRTATVSLHRRLHDPASVGYLLRSLPDDVRAPQTYEVFNGTKTYALTAIPAGTGTIEVLDRTWRARKLHLSLRLAPQGEEPSTDASELRVQEADLWVSTGPERLLLRLQGTTFWGWVRVELVGRGRLPSETT